MASILVIEDDPDVAGILNYNLVAAGHSPLVVTRGDEGIRYALETRPQLILLDLMLPDRAGIDVCRELKADPSTKDIPIIMVTAKSEEIDRVVGFELGADDYVTKPFSVRELLLRVKRSLERRSIQVDEPLNANLGALRIDRAAHRVFLGANEVSVSPLEFRLLTAFMEYQNRVLTRERLLKLVWGPDTSVCVRTVDAHVKRLRASLGPASCRIETVRGVGYRFGAAISATSLGEETSQP
jgi:two-component system phosphate regulon response regulator PhoB